MQGRHRPVFDLSGHARSDRHVSIGLDRLLVEFERVVEQVGRIGISEHHVRRPCCVDPTLQGSTISAQRHRDDARTERLGNLCRAVCAAVVGNHDFILEPISAVERCLHLFNAAAERPLFVETWKNKC